MLLAKLLLTPAIVVFATLAGRRFGRTASGWLIGLPLTSGPITAFFAVEHGRAFAARSAVGSLGGAIGEAAFCVAYAATSRRRGWPAAIAVGSLAFAAAATLMQSLSLQAGARDVVPLALTAAACLVAALRLVPKVPPRDDPVRSTSRWDVPARAVVATVFLLTLTGLATTLGAGLSGLIAVYPLYTVVLALFAHRQEGAGGAVQILRGLLVGLFSFVCFYAAVSLSLTELGAFRAFALALCVALTVQALSLRPLLRIAAA